MRYTFPEEGDRPEPWLAPLHLVADTIAGNHRFRFFAVEDFMVMAKLLRSGRPDITLYKHRYTRRYLNLDDAGRPYRYSVSHRADDNGRYLRHRSLEAALGALALWELPWMKETLAHERNPAWSPRAWDGDGDDGLDDELPMPSPGGEEAGRGHLRLV